MRSSSRAAAAALAPASRAALAPASRATTPGARGRFFSLEDRPLLTGYLRTYEADALKEADFSREGFIFSVD